MSTAGKPRSEELTAALDLINDAQHGRGDEVPEFERLDEASREVRIARRHDAAWDVMLWETGEVIGEIFRSYATLDIDSPYVFTAYLADGRAASVRETAWGTALDKLIDAAIGEERGDGS